MIVRHQRESRTTATAQRESRAVATMAITCSMRAAPSHISQAITRSVQAEPRHPGLGAGYAMTNVVCVCACVSGRLRVSGRQ